MKVTLALVTLNVGLLLASTSYATKPQLRDAIDQHVAAAWSANKVTPSEPSTDAEFLRRIYLDLHGRIPTYEQAMAFLSDTTADKRQKLISRLLHDPRYAVHQADVWDMVYFGRNPPGYGTDKREAFHGWLRTQFAKNVPYNVWAGQILRAEGNSIDQGPPLFLVQYKSRPEDAIEAVSRRFLGIQLQCARCHDHPFEPLTQKDFYGMAAFLARLQVVDVGKKTVGKTKLTAYAIGEKNKGDVLFTGPVSTDGPGKKGTPVNPKFLRGDPLAEPELPKDLKEPRNFPSGKMPPKPRFSRKDALADWITSADNPYFARAVTNRVWAQLVGRGIVHPVDNLSKNNPPSNPKLLEALTTAFVQQNYDMKWLIGEIVNSKTYQLSSRGKDAEAKPRLYQQARVRPLSAEELFESWMIASGYDKVIQAGGKKSDGRFRARGITWDYIRRFFGNPNDGVGDFKGGLHEHMYLNNGQVRQMISDRPGGLHKVLLDSKQPWEKRVERMFVQVLSRRPSDEETKYFVKHLSSDDDQRGRLHDAIWTLMTCSEFRFND